MNSTSKGSVRKTVIDSENAGQRLDNYLFRTCKGVPKSHIYQILRRGEVRVNSRRVDAAYRLQSGDTLRLPPIRVSAVRQVGHPPGHIQLPVIYDDACLLVVDKPAGIAVHGGSGISFGVIEVVRHQYPENRFLELAHRLDRETSGILIIAKKRSALNALHTLFRENQIDKHYLALVAGRFPDATRHARWPLFKYIDKNNERRVRVAENGKPAHTVFRLIARWQDFSLVEAQLKTGRTHQIRVHLAHMGYPIAGDDKYGNFALNRQLAQQGLKRMFLHAFSIECSHPREDKVLSLQTQLPPELQSFLSALGKPELNNDSY